MSFAIAIQGRCSAEHFIPEVQTALAPILESMGVEVLNCTPGSALHCFRHVELETALENENVAAG